MEICNIFGWFEELLIKLFGMQKNVTKFLKVDVQSGKILCFSLCVGIVLQNSWLMEFFRREHSAE